MSKSACKLIMNLGQDAPGLQKEQDKIVAHDFAQSLYGNGDNRAHVRSNAWRNIGVAGHGTFSFVT